jgi:hypothetical protein
MSDRISINNKPCKYRFNYERFKFAYNTAGELAQLIYANCKVVENPYEPQTSEYEEFNETIYSLQNKSY